MDLVSGLRVYVLGATVVEEDRNPFKVLDHPDLKKNPGREEEGMVLLEPLDPVSPGTGTSQDSADDFRI